MNEQELFEAYAAEHLANQDAEIVLNLGLTTISAVIAQLQLALRHPENDGAAAEIVRDFIERSIQYLRERGFEYSAIVAELGNDPANDRPI